MQITENCIKCKRPLTVIINEKDYQEWQNGKLIQDAMPYLSPDSREFLMSGICGECFDSLFSEEEK